MVKTPHFHCRGLGFDPYWGIKILHAARPKIIQKIVYYISKVKIQGKDSLFTLEAAAHHSSVPSGARVFLSLLSAVLSFD